MDDFSDGWLAEVLATVEGEFEKNEWLRNAEAQNPLEPLSTYCPE